MSVNVTATTGVYQYTLTVLPLKLQKIQILHTGYVYACNVILRSNDDYFHKSHF